MQNKFEKIAISALIVAVLFLGTMFLFQQKTINQIKSDVSGGNNAAINSLRNSLTADANLPKGNSQKNSQKTFPGEIKAIADNILEVDAKLMKADYSAESQSWRDSTIAKTIKVMLNDKTEYFGTKREKIGKDNLKVGDKIFLDADQSPFQTESLTALKIYLVDAWPSQLNQ